MAAETAVMGLGHVAALLGAGVIGVAVFRKIGLGSVLGYLVAGLAIGPFGLAVVKEPQVILHVAEFGVVIFLFLIGLEMRPSRLWAMKGDILGLGTTQVICGGTVLTLIGLMAGVPAPLAFVAAMGFVLSSTAIIMQMLEERGQIASSLGRRAVSTLLFEDLAIVPLLAIVAAMGAHMTPATSEVAGPPLWQTIGLAVGAVCVVLLSGRYLINPVFSFLARNGGREVMTAAALLVVVSTAWLLDAVGLSMAMGAFLAGVLLSDSTFRHQLEADVEPFRAILLGLFFLSVGMALDLSVVASQWKIVLAGLVAFVIGKSAVVYIVARIMKAPNREAIEKAALFSQGGEFAFVLYGAAVTAGVIDGRASAILSAIVVLSMALTPVTTLVVGRLLPAPKARNVDDVDGVDVAQGLEERVLIIGFGRFSQIVAQPLLAQNVDVSIIEKDIDMIEAAATFGFKVYYGDGCRLDTLRASGIERAEAVLVCIDNPEDAEKIVRLIRHEYPTIKILARAYDRGTSIRLVEAGVDYELRETFESAMKFGEQVLRVLDTPEIEIEETMEDVRRRDEERLALQVVDGLHAGRSLLRGNMTTPTPEPYIKPHREGRVITTEDMPPAPES